MRAADVVDRGTARRRRPAPPALRRADAPYAWLMSLPAILGLTLFLLVPFLVAVGASFTSYRLNSPLPWHWLGFDNYARLIHGGSFPRALVNNLLFAAIVVPLQTALAFALALLVNRPLRGMAVFRTLFFMPVVYPMALVSVVWALLYAPEQGALNQLLHAVTLGAWDRSTDFLRDPHLALPAIMAVSIWQGVGFQMVVMLAGLQAIPQALYEAAAVDGAGAAGRFLHITLPQMRNTVLFVVMVTTILAFRLFDQVWILTQGGPNDATTTVLYEAFVAARERNQVGLSFAMTVVFFVLVSAAALLQHGLLRQRRETA